MKHEPELLPYVQEMLLSVRGSWKVIAKDTGIHKNTIANIAHGHTPDPSVGKVEHLQQYLEANYAELLAH